MDLTTAGKFSTGLGLPAFWGKDSPIYFLNSKQNQKKLRTVLAIASMGLLEGLVKRLCQITARSRGEMRLSARSCQQAMLTDANAG